MKIVYLYPNSTFRTELRSDTLWGLLCWGIRFIYGNAALEKVLATYESGTPEFMISSTFPFIESDEKKHLFFPRPILPPSSKIPKESNPSISLKGMKDRKKLKDIAFISQKTLEEIANGTLSGQALSDYLLNQTESMPQYQSESITHNYLNRLTNGTHEENGTGQLFHVEEKFLSIKKEIKPERTAEKTLIKKKETNPEAKEKAGLFFLINGEETKIEAALRYLCQIGLGGDTSIGKGNFSYKMDDFKMPPVTNPNAMMNLSLYYPQKTELSAYSGSPYFQYIMEERKGKIAMIKGIYEKKMTMMFSEGSIFPYQETEVLGGNKIVQAENKALNIPYNIYQYGHAFMIPLQLPSHI